MKTIGLALVLSAAVPAFAGQTADPPPAAEMKAIDVAGASFSVWPYLSSDFIGKSDPVNLVFPNSDPRAIRQALMSLNASRPATPLSGLPGYACRWTDAMGYEQAAYSDIEDWTGGAVQLACIEQPGKPLGNPFRFHLRLFRAGNHTFGGAHYEWNIQGTAEHEVLSWDAARDFVKLDVYRFAAASKTPVAVTSLPAILPPGTFRAVRWPIYGGLVLGGAKPLLDGLGLVPVASGQPVPIPTSGAAVAFAGDFPFAPSKSDVTTSVDVTYSVLTNKPFCSGPMDYVKLEGPLHFALRVQTNPSGLLLRTYHVGGMLRVTPVNPNTGQPLGDGQDAAITETHRGQITDQYAEVTEQVAQVLLGDPLQSLRWTFAVGQRDVYDRTVSCGIQ